MSNGRKISIYAVECPMPRGGHHAYLMALDETNPEEPVICDELHFVPSREEGAEKSYLSFITKTAKRDLSSLKLYGYIGGNEEVIKELWDQAISVAQKIKTQQVPFSKAYEHTQAVNCRSGVKAVITALGLDYISFLDQANGIEGGMLDMLLPEEREVIKVIAPAFPASDLR